LALVSEATLPNQKILIATLRDAEKFAAEKIGQPALVVIGEVVRLADFAQKLPAIVGKNR